MIGPAPFAAFYQGGTMNLAIERSVGLLPTIIVLGGTFMLWSQRNRFSRAVKVAKERREARKDGIQQARRRHPSYPFGRAHVGNLDIQGPAVFYDQDEQPWG